MLTRYARVLQFLLLLQMYDYYSATAGSGKATTMS
jgi:hypothetical protein